jgi:glycosyltransferase involved in cell wall biosynthesis
VNWNVNNGQAIITRICSKARFIVAQSENLSELITATMPRFQDRLVMIPKSFAWFGSDYFDLRKTAQCNSEDILFFMPAGLRPVKGNLDCLLKMKQVWEARPRVKIIFAGESLDASYSKAFVQEVERFAPRASWIPPIPPAAMRTAYSAADVVVNASTSEGLSNALIEAMAAGRPVLASDIPGNRRPLSHNNGHGAAGLLFDLERPQDFYKKALRLVDDGSLRKRLGQAGAARAMRLSNPDQEAEHLIRIYDQARRNNSRNGDRPCLGLEKPP